jgi:CHAT domain-containing protein/tetratricopeptide (TPR) repeat protein
MKYLIQALLFFAIATPATGYAQQWKSLADSAGAYRDKNPEKCFDFARQARAAIPADSLQTPAVAQLNYDEGIAYVNLRKYPEAESMLIEARRIQATTLGKESGPYGITCHSLGNVYYQMNKYQQAESYYNESLAIKEKVFGRPHAQYTRTLGNIAQLYETTGRLAEAEQVMKDLLAIREETLGKLHRDYIVVLGAIGGIYLKKAMLTEAVATHSQARDLAAQALGREHPEYGNTCNNLALDFVQLGRYAEAVSLYLEYVEIQRKAVGTAHPNYALGLNNLASVYESMGKLPGADSMATRSREIYGVSLGKKHLSYANACITLANIRNAMGNFTSAEALLLEALETRLALLGRQHAEYAAVLNNLGSLYRSMALYDKAESRLLEALNLREQILGKDHPALAITLFNLGLNYTEMARYADAERVLQRSLEIRGKAYGKEHELYAKSLNGLGILYVQMAQRQKARLHYLEALEIRQKVLGTDHRDYAETCNNLAILYWGSRQYDDALPLQLEAMRACGVALGKEHPQYAYMLNNLALLYDDMGRGIEAEALLLEAQALRARTIGKTHPLYASSLHNLSIHFFEARDNRKAQEYAKESMAIFKAVYGTGHEDYTQAAENLAAIMTVNGQIREAAEIYRTCFESRHRQLLQLMSFTSEQEKSEYFHWAQLQFDRYLSFYHDHPEIDAGQVYNLAFQVRNLSLASGQQMRKLLEGSSPEILRQYDQWTQMRRQLAVFYAKGSLPDYAKPLEDSAHVLEKILMRVSPSFSNEKKDWHEIAKALKPGEAAIEFLNFRYFKGDRWTDTSYYMAVVLKQGQAAPVVMPLFEEKALLRLFQSGKSAQGFYRGIETTNAIARPDSVAYQLVWRALEPVLAGTTKIFYAPSGLLHKVSFAALPISSDTLLSDRYHLSCVGSTARIMEGPAPGIGKKDAIALYGGVDYDKSASSAPEAASGPSQLPEDETRRNKWNFLKGTQSEVTAIAAIAKQQGFDVRTYTGTQASEEQIKTGSSSKAPVVLHMATHGFFFPDPETTPPANTPEASGFSRANDPLLRAGLLFAGANAAWTGSATAKGEDGVLTAYEIANLYLPKTRLVVMSACETGLGDVRGSEGVFGLQRAVKMAGADCLVMSLWKVPDAETAEFMREFYTQIFDGKPIEAAFVNAQNALKTKYRSQPYKWAAWVLMR